MLALDGIRVLDITQIMAGPYCTMVLGDLGAEVIKIEKPDGGDDSRQMGPYVNGESTCFFQINRNKKSLALNLKHDQGKAIFRQLAESADVIVENFRPGVTRSLGIDYDSIRAFNPGIIYCAISGYGQTGPYSHRGGFDLVAQGMSGLMNMTGEPDGRPLKAGTAVYDIGAGITAVYSILAAYIHRLKTGEGQLVDVAVAEAGLPWFCWEAAAYFGIGELPRRSGWRHRVSAPYQAFKTASGYIILGCANQRTWERLCNDVLDRPELIADPRFVSNLERQRHVDELEQTLEAILTDHDSAHWLALCDQAGVPAGPINDFAEALQDPHYQARDMVQELEHPVLGRMKALGFASKLSGTPPETRYPAPTLGQHTDEILAGQLSLSAEQIGALRDQGTIG